MLDKKKIKKKLKTLPPNHFSLADATCISVEPSSGGYVVRAEFEDRSSLNMGYYLDPTSALNYANITAQLWDLHIFILSDTKSKITSMEGQALLASLHVKGNIVEKKPDERDFSLMELIKKYEEEEEL